MSKLLRIVALLLMLSLPAYAITSTIDPTVPATDSDLDSEVIRDNFLNAYNDVNALWNQIGPTVLNANQILGALTNGPAQALPIPNCNGTSNALNWTFSTGFGCQTILAASTAGPAGGDLIGNYPNPQLANTSQARLDLGLGTAAVASTGTSGAVVPLLNANNVFSGTNNFTGGFFISGVAAAPSATTDTTNAGNISSGTLAFIRLPTLAANQILGTLSGGPPAPQPIPSCTGGTNALSYSLSSGFGCQTISVPTPPAPSAQTTDYTLQLADNTGFIRVNCASNCAITVPTNASVAFPLGAEVTIMWGSTAQVSFAAAGGVTILSPSTLTLLKQNATASIKQIAANTWVLAGAIQ